MLKRESCPRVNYPLYSLSSGVTQEWLERGEDREPSAPGSCSAPQWAWCGSPGRRRWARGRRRSRWEALFCESQRPNALPSPSGPQRHAPPTCGWLQEWHGRKLLLVRHRGEVFCSDSHCFHMGADLVGGDIEECVTEGGTRHTCIVCPQHRYRVRPQHCARPTHGLCTRSAAGRISQRLPPPPPLRRLTWRAGGRWRKTCRAARARAPAGSSAHTWCTWTRSTYGAQCDAAQSSAQALRAGGPPACARLWACWGGSAGCV
jgi:nitrite reductase/ring-hydroxylating ferredoxin subunit